MRHFLLHLDERLQLIIIATIVGILGAVGSVALNRSLAIVSGWLHTLHGHWYVFLFPACGAIAASLFLNHITKDVGGHGVPEVIYSVSKRGGLLRLRSIYSHLVACVLTIASGGSAGPEAPVVVSGSSIGSNIASFFRLKDRQRVVLVGCGAAAAIAAIFNAPVAGIVFALEAILGEWTAINIIPIAISSVVGTEISRLLQGNQIPFQNKVFTIAVPDLIACLGLAVFTAVGSIVLMRVLKFIGAKSKAFIPYEWMRAGAGGLLVGIIAMLLPEVLGEGYELIRIIIEQRFPSGMYIIGLIIVAKIMATSLTVGTGRSGGLFAPCLVIGSFIGLLYQRCLVTALPSVSWAGESYFALLGMAGLISSVMQAPMTGIFLIVEITGSYQVLISVVLLSVISATLSHYFEPFSVYHQELIARGSLARPRTDKRILSELNITELLERDCHIVYPEMFLKDLVSVVQQTNRNYFPVENSKTGEFLGMIHLDKVRSYLFDPVLYNSVLVEELMNTEVAIISLDDDLSDVFDLFDRTHSFSLPVVQDKKFLGLISKATILDHYRKELMVQEEI